MKKLCLILSTILMMTICCIPASADTPSVYKYLSIQDGANSKMFLPANTTDNNYTPYVDYFYQPLGSDVPSFGTAGKTSAQTYYEKARTFRIDKMQEKYPNGFITDKVAGVPYQMDYSGKVIKIQPYNTGSNLTNAQKEILSRTKTVTVNLKDGYYKNLHLAMNGYGYVIGVQLKYADGSTATADWKFQPATWNGGEDMCLNTYLVDTAKGTAATGYYYKTGTVALEPAKRLDSVTFSFSNAWAFFHIIAATGELSEPADIMSALPQSDAVTSANLLSVHDSLEMLDESLAAYGQTAENLGEQKEQYLSLKDTVSQMLVSKRAELKQKLESELSFDLADVGTDFEAALTALEATAETYLAVGGNVKEVTDWDKLAAAREKFDSNTVTLTAGVASTGIDSITLPVTSSVPAELDDNAVMVTRGGKALAADEFNVRPDGNEIIVEIVNNWDYSSDYTVRFGKGVINADDPGFYLKEAYSVTFKAKKPVTVSDAVLTNSDGEIISAAGDVKDGTVNISASLANDQAAEQAYGVLIAVYSDKFEMLGAVTCAGTLVENGVRDISGTVKLPENTGSFSVVTYAVDDFSTLSYIDVVKNVSVK